MVRERGEKVARLSEEIPEQEVSGPTRGDLLVIGWGGTAGSVRAAIDGVRRSGGQVAAACIRYIHPFPRNLGDVLSRYRKILTVEMNSGHLALLLRDRYGVEIEAYSKIQGRPPSIGEVRAVIEERI
jgi:2-oxoglutarate ferredoxin oxidoreductase subunit alpha